MIFTPIPLFLVLQAPCAGAPDRSLGERTIQGHCVEARTASVFAGACHFGAEATTAGREAVIALHVESGAPGGVDLAGVDVVAAIAGKGNLAEPSSARRSILYLSDRASAERRAAAEAFVRSSLGSALGRIVEVAVVPLRIEIAGDRYRVDGGDLFQVEGELLPDRACCRMPYSVWYEPFLPLAGPVVGQNAVFRFSDARLGRAWERFDENTGFAGAFAFRAHEDRGD